MKSEILGEGESNLTKIYIKSTREDEEIKDTGEDLGTRLFEEGKNLSPINPFEEMQDTPDAKEKVIHLSTINTNEHFCPEFRLNDILDKNNPDEILISKEGALKALEGLAASGSVVEVISQKDEPDESLITEK